MAGDGGKQSPTYIFLAVLLLGFVVVVILGVARLDCLPIRVLTSLQEPPRLRTPAATFDSIRARS